MVVRSCLCYKKCLVRPTLFLKAPPLPRYPGLFLLPPPSRSIKTSSVIHTQSMIHTHSLDIPPISTTCTPTEKLNNNDRLDLDHVINKTFTQKRANTLYKRLARKKSALDIYTLFNDKLASIEYKQLRKAVKESAAFLPLDKIQQLMQLCTVREWRLDLFDELLTSYELNRNLGPLLNAIPSTESLYFYNVLLSKCFKAEEYQHIQEVLARMKQRNIQPDTTSFNILVRLKLSTAKDGFEVYQEMISQGVKANHATFNTFLRYAVIKQQWHTLKVWLDMMEEDSIRPNYITGRILFKAFVDNSTQPEVVEAFERVSHVVPLAQQKESLLNTGTATLLKAKKQKAALDLLQKTFDLDEPLSAYAYNLLIHALCLDGKVEDAKEVLQKMISEDNDIPQPDIVSFTTYINGLIKSNHHTKLDELGDVYKQVLEQDLNTNNVLESVIFYGVARSGQLDKMQSMFRRMLENTNIEGLPRHKTDTRLKEMNIYNIMMDFYFVYCHRTKKAMPQEPIELLKDAIDKGLKPTVVTMNILVRGIALLYKDLPAAERAVTLLQQQGIRLDEKTIWYLVKSAHQQGQLTKARHWIERYEATEEIKGTGLNYLKSVLMTWQQSKTTVV